jgi:hypothetical protein
VTGVKLTMARDQYAWRLRKLREFDAAVAQLPQPMKEEILRMTTFFRQAYDDLLKECRARLEPDRELLIQTAARFMACGFIPTESIRMARDLIAAADAE